MIPIHPDDVLLFKEVTDVMRRVAKIYELPLRSISGYSMPKIGMADRLGDCAYSGDIRLVLRCTVDGQWCDEPLNPEEVWKTAAHELAHLRFMNHGLEFQDFCHELEIAIENQRTSHRQKIINKLIKLQASRQSEAEIGNAEAAEAFAGMINKMLIEYELNPTDIDYARAADNDPVIELQTQLITYGIKPQKTRCAWQESLASSVADAHLCKILIRPNSNKIWFVGTKSHATVAEYVFGTMVPLITKMSKNAELKYWKETGCGRGEHNQALGYRAAWIDAFIKRIRERFAEARKTAVAEASSIHGNSTETSLIRLDGSLMKVRKYIDDKFSYNKAARHAAALHHRYHHHPEGRAAGRKAADSIALGRRGINPLANHKQLGE